MPQPRQVREEPSQVQRQHHSDTGQGAARARGGAKPPTAPFGRNGIATVQGGLSGSTRTPQLLQASHPLLAQPHASTTPLLSLCSTPSGSPRPTKPQENSSREEITHTSSAPGSVLGPRGASVRSLPQKTGDLEAAHAPFPS